MENVVENFILFVKKTPSDSDDLNLFVMTLPNVFCLPLFKKSISKLYRFPRIPK